MKPGVKPRLLDLFSGVGGFSIGFERADFETVAFSEIEPFPCRVLAERRPNVPNLGDIREITPEQIEALGQIDVVTFGSPCQDWSVAGKRLGLEGHRSSLFHEAIRIIRIVRPRFALFENVPGLFSSAGGWDFAAVLDELAESGALDIAWSVLDAQWFGVPQRRRRIFVVADFRGERAGEILSLSEGVYRDLAPSRETEEEAARGSRSGSALSLTERTRANGRSLEYQEDTAYALTNPGKGGRDQSKWVAQPIGIDSEFNADEEKIGANAAHQSGGAELFVAEVADGLTTRYGKGVNTTADDGAMVPVVAPESRSNYYSDHDGDEDRLIPIQDASMPREKKQNGIGVGNPGAPMYTLDSHGAHAVAFAENQRGEVRTSDTHPQSTAGGGKPGQGYPAVAFNETGQGWWNKGDRAGTLRAEGENRPSRPSNVVGLGMAVRRLTPLECERLQGFPDGWTDIPGASDSARYRAMGNAVAVPVVEWIAERMAEEFAGEARDREEVR